MLFSIEDEKKGRRRKIAIIFNVIPFIFGILNLVSFFPSSFGEIHSIFVPLLFSIDVVV